MSLEFNVSQLLKAEVGQTRLYAFDAEEPIDLDGSTVSDVRGRVKFALTNFGVVATGEADGTLHLNCARCLEDFDKPAHVSFTDEYRPTVDIGTGLASSVPQSETAFDISANHTIDLTEALRQHFLLAVDLIPVCRDDCQGLCPTCGVNRNVESCACPPPEEPSPFAVLQGLLGDRPSEQ
jgi:uncharacterized protein